MTILSFNQLSYTDKINLLYKEGVYVGKHKTNTAIVVLYQLHHFYIEIHYADYRKVIASLKVSEDVEILTPYLEQIDVKELIASY